METSAAPAGVPQLAQLAVDIFCRLVVRVSGARDHLVKHAEQALALFGEQLLFAYGVMGDCLAHNEALRLAASISKLANGPQGVVLDRAAYMKRAGPYGPARLIPDS
jgi:hypothetical protein